MGRLLIAFAVGWHIGSKILISCGKIIKET